jgi:hypothetical protein
MPPVPLGNIKRVRWNARMTTPLIGGPASAFRPLILQPVIPHTQFTRSSFIMASITWF